MSHYRLRAGISAYLASLKTPNMILGRGLLLGAFLASMPLKAQNLGPVGNTIAPLPLSPQENQLQQELQKQAPVPFGEPPRPTPVGSLRSSTLVPSRAEVTVLKLDDQLRAGKPIPDSEALTFSMSDEIDGVVDRQMNLKGRAQIRRNGTVIKADEINYDPDTDIANLIGNAELIKGTTQFSGPRARLKADARQGEMDKPKYEFRDVRGRGQANKLTIESADVFIFDKATYTTCSPDNLDWYFTASRIEVDQEQKQITGRDGVMHFFDVPIAYAPYFSLPTSNQRRSGLLTPLIGYNSNNGFDAAQPYYVNIAPNRDLTITPRFMNQRGVLLGADYRFIDPKYSGFLQGKFINYDKITQTSRWSLDWQQRQMFSKTWNAYATVTKVSDSFFPIDFSYGIAGALTTLNRQEIGTGFTGIKNWNINMRALTFQTLQPDPTAISNAPYNILPQITANYSNRLNFSDKPKSSLKTGTQNLVEPSQNKSAQGMQAFLSPVVALGLEFSRFSYNANTSYGPASGLSQGGTFSQADRAVLKGSISNPLVTPGYFLRPKLSIQANNYSGTLINGIAGSNQIKQPNPPIQGFVIPTFSLDSGLAFERDAMEMKGFFGRDMVLTIEPRAFYVFTPFQNQAQTPLFDTADAGFGISQIFSENTFVGNDRVADNNKLTMGLTSRMIETNSGTERATFTLAQRQDFTGQRVGLNGTIQNPTRYSDTLGASTIRLMGNFNVDLFGQYNTQLNRFVQSSIGTSWRPTPGRSLNFSYRNVWNPPTDGTNSGITQTDQYNAFGEWPVFKKYRLLGRWGYDALTAKTLNTLFGLQYDEDCWTARFAYSQVRNTSQITTTQVLFQLEFRGFASVGNNPVDVMRLNVPGYQPLVKPLPPSSFENYQ